MTADFTATTFCDCSSLRGLLAVQRAAASCGAQLRLAIRPGTAVSRVAQLIGLDRRLAVYPSLEEASRWPARGQQSQIVAYPVG